MRDKILNQFYSHLIYQLSHIRDLKKRLIQKRFYKDKEVVDIKNDLELQVEAFKRVHSEYQYLIENLLSEEKRELPPLPPKGISLKDYLEQKPAEEIGIIQTLIKG